MGNPSYFSVLQAALGMLASSAISQCSQLRCSLACLIKVLHKVGHICTSPTEESGRWLREATCICSGLRVPEDHSRPVSTCQRCEGYMEDIHTHFFIDLQGHSGLKAAHCGPTLSIKVPVNVKLRSLTLYTARHQHSFIL